MLLSPGHSPRPISSPEREPPSSASPATDSAGIRRRSKVLDEDSYVAAIEKIIERDFFPDIPKLRDRLDWLDAVKTGDPLQIRDAQLKIIERRRGAGEKSDRRTQTPGSTFARNFTPLSTPLPTAGAGALSGGGEGSEESIGAGVDPKLSLDEFFRRYTSEDNESFSKILEKVNRKRKERYAFLLEGENKDNESSGAIEHSKRDRITDGFGTSDQPPSTLESWNFTAKNLLMYHPADRGEAPLTIEERSVRMKALEKEISRPNTRFHGKQASSRPMENGVEILYAPIAGSTPVQVDRAGDEKGKRYDLDELRKTPLPTTNAFYLESGKKSENGYGFVRTPSPAPESPFVTWGEIEGTPMRLEPEEEGPSGGPRYRIPCPPSRDEKAHSLSRDAARRLRERSKMFQKPPLHSPAPARGGSASPSVRTMSRAAQKFVRNAIAKSSSGFDETLRASYRGSSPAAVTPKSVSRLGRDSAPRTSRSPSVGEGSNLPW